MATTIPVIQGKMGSTRYWLGKMSARELAGSARPACYMDEWASLSIEERMQRDLNVARVEKEIAPYLANSPDRFFGAIVVLVHKGELSFEPLTEVIKTKVPKAYERGTEDLGFLGFDDVELIVLDGQHRLSALQKVLQGEISGITAGDVARDEIEVVFLRFDDEDKAHQTEKIRRIFNKLNRYAKPTSRGDNIITSEDDGYAILTRRLLGAGEPLGHEVVEKGGQKDLIVNWKSNTIAQRSVRFTTISAVYETVKTILAHHGITGFDEKSRIVRPEETELDAAYEHVQRWWDAVVHGVTAFKEAFEDYRKIPDMRDPGQPHSLLLKPAAHIILFSALSEAQKHGVSLDQAIERVNKINWDLKDAQWKNILIQANDRISARKEHYDVTAAYVAYLIAGQNMSPKHVEEIRQAVGSFHGDEEGYVLPETLS